jgi:hypothetical protein
MTHNFNWRVVGRKQGEAGDTASQNPNSGSEISGFSNDKEYN